MDKGWPFRVANSAKASILALAKLVQSLISWFGYQIEFTVGHLYAPSEAVDQSSTHTATDWNSDQTPIQLLEVECFEQEAVM